MLRIARMVATSPITIWAGFVLVHLWLGAVNLYGPGLPLGDVSIVYKFWTDQALVAHYWVGIDASWVYPIVAMVPMLLARTFGPALYSNTWLSLVMLLDAVALAAITGWGRGRVRAAVAWWWIVFLLVLGPISLGRIDSITIPLAIVGVLFIATRPRVAAVLLIIATWIKVWPAAILAALVIGSKDRVTVALTAGLTSLGIIASALALGSGANVFSFITQQTNRGLQVESPVSTIWLWEAFARVPGASLYYDQNLLTWQVRGPGVAEASALMSLLLAVAALGIVILSILAVRAGHPAAELLPTISLAFVTVFIAFNKVGSPQYMTWLAVPVILGLATRHAGLGRSFRFPAIMSLVLAGLTQLFYPYLYGYLLGLYPAMLLVITAKNVLLFVLLGWAVAVLVRATRALPFEQRVPDAASWSPSPWPFPGGTTPSLSNSKE